MEDVKFCVDCKYHNPRSSVGFPMIESEHVCEHPLVMKTSLVTGEKIHINPETRKKCSHLREKTNSGCGRTGIWFEPRETE